MLKICTKCKKDQELIHFYKMSSYKKDGYSPICKHCHKLRMNSYRNHNLTGRKNITRNLDTSNYKNYHKIYRQIRLKNDIQYKLQNNLRSRLNRTLRGDYKSGSAVKDLGCTITELKQYLESKFQSGMTWDNYGRNGWHIDHIIPLTAFNLLNRKEFLKACHYTNLQPLWAKDNRKKSNTIGNQDS